MSSKNVPQDPGLRNTNKYCMKIIAASNIFGKF